MVQLTFKPGSVVSFGRAYRTAGSHAPRRATSTKTAQASARRQARPRRTLREGVITVVACLLAFAVAEVTLINFLFFPECNRTTGDCFLIQHAWGAK